MVLKNKNHLGIFIPFIIAIIASYISSNFHLISSSVLALLLGITLNIIISDTSNFNSGLNFTSKKLLKLAIILLGTNLSFAQILEVGKYSLFVMLFTLSAAFGFGYLFGKMLKIDWKLSSLISAGTGICGGSAIATISPIIDAEDTQIAYAISATFIFDMLMIILFPIMGQALGLSDMGFGLWAGTAVNDTSSVVATAYAFSEQAGDFATIVKLTRTLAIVPISLIFVFISSKMLQKENTLTTDNNLNIKKVFPTFILFFVLTAIINSIGLIPTTLLPYFKTLSKFLMCMSLAAIGLKTDLKKMFHAGYSPMILGFLVSTIVVVFSLFAQMLIGQI